ncbi:hypothetical protein D6B98_36925 [Bradyrhizobium sp. LVM 105]|nr:hypothetical protein D6B98_36925 [Bradyrhizobium sp. LVM 105]
MRAMAAGKKWFSAPGNQGFVTMPEILAQHSDWTEFAMRGKKAAVEAGFAPDTAGQLFGAIGELRGNIEEHSENTGSGYTAYEAKDRLQTNESPMRPLGPKDNVSPRHATRAGAPHSGTDLESWQPVGRD